MQEMSLGDSRSSHSEVFLDKGVLKICSKFPEEHPCRSMISKFDTFASEDCVKSVRIQENMDQEKHRIWILFTQWKQPEVFYKKVVLKYFAKLTGKHLRRNLFYDRQACGFIEKGTLTYVFSQGRS